MLEITENASRVESGINLGIQGPLPVVNEMMNGEA